MKRTLGIDLGTNSIGWALTENDKIIELGTRIIPRTTEINRSTKKETEHYGLKKISKNRLITAFLIVSTGIMAFANYENWQFWLGLCVASLLTLLSLDS